MLRTKTSTLLFRVMHLFMLRTCFSFIFVARFFPVHNSLNEIYIHPHKNVLSHSVYTIQNVCINMITVSFNINEKSPLKIVKCERKMRFGLRGWMTKKQQQIEEKLAFFRSVVSDFYSRNALNKVY